MKRYIKLFEELTQQERNDIQTLESYGFTIDKKFDSKGHLYAVHIVLPWHAVDIVGDLGQQFKQMYTKKGVAVVDIRINVLKSDIKQYGISTFGGFRFNDWGTNRDIDKALSLFVDWFESIQDQAVENAGIKFIKGLDKNTLDDRKLDSDLSDSVNDLW